MFVLNRVLFVWERERRRFGNGSRVLFIVITFNKQGVPFTF